jgi:hypothetical protein
MTNQSPYSWYNAQPASAPGASPSVTEVDARVRGGLMVVCEFKGHEHDPDRKRRCKLYDKSSQRGCCMYYHEEITAGVCDNPT